MTDSVVVVVVVVVIVVLSSTGCTSRYNNALLSSRTRS